MDVGRVAGIGPKKIKELNEIGIFTILDLLNYYPTSITYKDVTSLNEDKILVEATILKLETVRYVRRNLKFFKFSAVCNNQMVNFTVFNQVYLKKSLKVGKSYLIEATKKADGFIVSKVHFGETVPFVDVKYRQTKELSNTFFKKVIKNALFSYHHLIEEVVPEELKQKYKLLPLKQALYIMHNPKNSKEVEYAKRTLKYNEAYTFMKILQDSKKEKSLCDFSEFNFDSGNFINELDFKLTPGQMKALAEIILSMKKNVCINHLIHGDVGSGKTILAIVMSNIFINNNFQVAILCPTEVLAKQMSDNFSNLLPDGELLINNMPSSKKAEIIKKTESGEIKYLVGTHSIISEKIKFANLGLVVVDEQHRFGVEQRANLISKLKLKNVLYMSATPIPRTIGLILHDNLQITKVEGRPLDRKQVITRFKSKFDKELINHVNNEINSGHSVFAIAPAITENALNLENVESISKEYEKHFPGNVIGCIHGKINKEEQDKIIEKFRNGEIDILVSTTIVEVGVDIKNATTMIIHSAERYGLAQLHQLRGRVGRNNLQSYCYILSGQSNQRLEFFTSCNDGFEISEADYKMRGPGNLIGIEQSGYNIFKILDIFNDAIILEHAKNDVKKING